MDDRAKNPHWSAPILILLALGSGLLSAQTPPPADQPSSPIRRVLIVNDQNSFSTTRALVDYEIQRANPGSKYRIEVDHEYLDVPQIPSEAERELVRDFLIRKYRDRRPDAIVTLGAYALQFMAEEHQHDFAGIPLVYCFSNGAEKDLKPDPEITGTTMSLDAASTLSAALHMLPHTRQVFVITGTAAYDLEQIQPVKNQLEDFSSRVDITYLAGLAMPELLKRLGGLPKDSIVLLCTHSRDGAGTYFSFQQNGSLIDAAANAPVFSLIDVQIGYGQVGGDLAQTKEEGTIAGREALKILDGVKPSDIPVAKVPNSFVFDWPALKRWGIKESDLPPGSAVLNRPPSPWEMYKGYIVGGLTLMLLEALLIAGLLLQRRMRREAERRYRDIFDGAIEGIYRTTSEGRYLVANPAQAHMLGYDSPEDLIASVKDLAHDVWFDPNERNIYKRALDERGEVYGFVCRFKRKDGEIVWFSLNGKKVADATGQTLYYDGFVEEVTQQKRSEMELQERAERLKQAEVVAQLGHSSWDVDSNISTWSEGMYRITGWDPARPAPRHEERALLYSPESLARLNEAVERALATGEPYNLEVQFTRRDGALRWARALGRAVRNDIGRIYQLIGTLQDITEQKLSEMTLRDSEEQFRATFEQAAVGIIHVSFEGRILRCNPRFAAILGYSTDEVVGMRFQDFTPPEFLAKSDEVLEEFTSGQIGETGWEKPYIRKDGRRIWVRLKTSIQRDGKGQPLHLVTFVEDITDRRLAEEHLAEASKELQASETRFRTIFESAAMGCSMLDLEGHYLESNLALQNILGYSETELLRMTPRDYTHPDDLERDQQLFHELAEGRRTNYETEKRYIRKDGRVVWARITASLVRDAQGKPQYAVGMVQDITEQKLAVQALEESEARFRTLIEEAPLGVAMSRDALVLYANKAYLEMYGLQDLNEVVGQSVGKQWSAETRAVVEERSRRRLRGEEVPNYLDGVGVRRDGSAIYVHAVVNTVRLADGPANIAFVTDMTESKRAEEHLAAASKELQASELRHRTVFQTSQDALNISRLSDGKLVDVNKTFLDLTGFQREEVIGRTTVELDIWANPSDRINIVDELRRNSGVRDIEVLFKRKDGNTFWGLTSASVIEFDGIPHVLVAARDVSEAKDAVKTIRDLAFYDPLTHLPNRRSLLDLLEQTHEGEPRMRALLFVDLDNFKSLNDALGHHAGDLLLQEAAQRLAACVRGEGTVVRLGGDEFAVVLEDMVNTPEHAAEQARQVGERILTAATLPYLVEERECHLSSSIGITVFGSDLEGGLEALQHGEIAMTKAKEAGRNTIRFFAPELQANVNARVHLENELRRAIKAEEFELYFQPQVKGGRLVGSEALIRWNHPQRGCLAPGAFIDVVEDTGLILPLGNWVLWKACDLVAGWAGKNSSGDAPVAVNISGRQFSQPDFVERVLATLDSTGANPATLKFELTETSLVNDFQDVVAKMTELKAHGLRFSVDDFGTGYSSLAYLKRLPLDQLKIDRAFVKDILFDGPSGAIAQAIISMGHSMGFSVIAEGVETAEQRDFLIGLGCDCFQGYFYSRPVPADEFERVWLRQSS